MWKIPANAWESGEFPKCLGIWKIPEIPGNLENSSNFWVILRVVNFLSIRNFPNFQRFAEFSKYSVTCKISKIFKVYHPQIPVGIWDFSQMLGTLGYSQNSYFLQKYNCCLIMKKFRPLGCQGGFKKSSKSTFEKFSKINITWKPGYTGGICKNSCKLKKNWN